jgi:hypothetical protein
MSKTRTDQAEKRVQELQAMLDAEITEHRRVVAALIEKLPAPVAPRRVWWPWGRR